MPELSSGNGLLAFEKILLGPGIRKPSSGI
jgi:hypothetical protein